MQKKSNNIGKLLVLGLIGLILLADKVPVVFDSLNHKENSRLHDSWGDAMKDIFYFIIIGVVWLTMKFKENKADFIVVLLFAIGIMLCVSSIGFYKFLVETILAVAMLAYLTVALIVRLLHRHKIRQIPGN